MKAKESQENIINNKKWLLDLNDIEKRGPAILVNKLTVDWKIYKHCEITPPNPIKRVKEQLKYIEPDIRCVSEGHWNSKAHKGKTKTSWKCTTQQNQICASCLLKGECWGRLLGKADCPAWATNFYWVYEVQKWDTQCHKPNLENWKVSFAINWW